MADLTGASTHLQLGAWPGMVYGDFLGKATWIVTRVYGAICYVEPESRVATVALETRVARVDAEDRICYVEEPLR